MKKIFVSAYACEPNLGSEIGVGWNWVLQMSRSYKIWVLTRQANKSSIENWLKKNQSYRNINFIYYDLPYYLRFWKKKKRGVRIYYNLWQILSNSIVKKIMLQNEIKIFHHLTYGNALWRTSSFGQKQFFIWGPVGGLESIDKEYWSFYPPKGKVLEIFRSMVINLLPLNNTFKNQCRNANLILCKTDITKKIIKKFTTGKLVLFTDVAIDESKIMTEFNKNNNLKKSNIIQYVVIGNLDFWRGYDLLIEAFSLAIKEKNNLRLTILGNGQAMHSIKKMIELNSLNKYTSIIDQLSMKEYTQLLKNSDVLINPSLKEAAVSVAFDSMAYGVPLICTDTSGYTNHFSKNCAIKIPIPKQRDNLISLLKAAILDLENNHERSKISKECLISAKRNTWEIKGKKIKNIIDESISLSNHK